MEEMDVKSDSSKSYHSGNTFSSDEPQFYQTKDNFDLCLNKKLNEPKEDYFKKIKG